VRSSYSIEKLKTIPLISKPLTPGEYMLEIKLVDVKGSSNPVIKQFNGLTVRKVAG